MAGAGDGSKASALSVRPVNRFITGDKLAVLEQTIGSLNPDESIFFKTDGAWSNIHLVEFILMQTGAADVFFTTWSISADAIACFTNWQQQGAIKQLWAVLDAGIRNRKPEIYQQATAAFANLKISHCHAKVIVIQNTFYQVTVIGSANFTRNPRIEAGVIIWNKKIAEQNVQWILEEFNHE